LSSLVAALFFGKYTGTAIQNVNLRMKTQVIPAQIQSPQSNKSKPPVQVPKISVVSFGLDQDGATVTASAELSTNETGLCHFGFTSLAPVKGLKTSKETKISNSAHCSVELPKSELKEKYWDADMFFLGDDSTFAQSDTKFLTVQ
jgi:hypothetical protein